MATLKLEIVTPEAKVFSQDVEVVYVPGVDGELGILPRHIPLMTMIKPGELRVTSQGRDLYMAVGEGFVEVTAESVTVLTDMAIEEKSIDESAAEEAVKRAQAALHGEHLTAEEVASVEAALQKSLAQLHVKRRRHS
ncbi:MAG TPA: F0F1 ATP synthase subunit epsilon [Chthoniobacteraceae bacterium]|jgi:F-type H+-transporting ATPase subunit epsilon|nr:F0F1 ATP synthase subunit epsilon [Chthoniobacteraceae bacterium]